MDIEGTAGEGSEGCQEQVIGNWRKVDSCYMVAESLAELFLAVMWKADLVTDELGHFSWEHFQVELRVWLHFFLLPSPLEQDSIADNANQFFYTFDIFPLLMRILIT